MINLELSRGWGVLKEPSQGTGSFDYFKPIEGIMRFLIPFLLLIFILPEATFSQETSGKIITSQQADSLFGLPDKIYKFETFALLTFTESSGYLYFHFSDSGLLIVDNKKEPLYPRDLKLQGSETFTVYSSSVINELLNRGDSEYVEIQLRKNVLTISNGNHTLEYGMLCPPYCY